MSFKFKNLLLSSFIILPLSTVSNVAWSQNLSDRSQSNQNFNLPASEQSKDQIQLPEISVQTDLSQQNKKDNLEDNFILLKDFNPLSKEVLSEQKNIFFKQVIKSAKEGNRIEQFVLGDMFSDYSFGTPDFVQAVSWYKQAAWAGVGQAADRLGTIFLQGKPGVSKDIKQANYWFQIGAKSNSSFSQDALGDSYLLGREVLKDTYKAMSLYAQAANSDNIRSQIKLSGFYSQGIIVDKNPAEAYYWLRLAQTNSEHESFPQLDDNMQKFATLVDPAQKIEIDKKIMEIRKN